MQALWLEKIGHPLELREVAAPAAVHSSVVVEFVSVRVLSYKLLLCVPSGFGQARDSALPMVRAKSARRCLIYGDRHG